MNNCIFCKIVKGEVPSIKVWEDAEHIAILDRTPITKGHTLLIPKKHSEYLFDLNDKEYSKLMLSAKKLAKLLKEKLKPKRIGLALEGFGVPHIHLHLVPINHGNELNPEKAKPMSQEELNKIAEIIKSES